MAAIRQARGTRFDTPETIGPASTQMRNIYIVDDDAAVRQSLHYLLTRQSDCAVHGLTSGDAFLERRHELQPGVVLLDYHMPGTRGIEVAERLAEERSRFAVLMLTAHGDVALSVAAMKAGVDDFIEKPYEPGELLLRLDSAFARLGSDQRCAELRQAAKMKLSSLSPRENDVLMGLMEGRANKEIAHTLGISPRTVEIYRANMMTKLDVRTLSHALRVVYAAGVPA